MSRKHNNEFGQSWSIAAALLDSPKTEPELIKHYKIMSRRFGFYMELIPGQHGFRNAGKIAEIMSVNLARLTEEGWIRKDSGRYCLEEKGRLEAVKMINELEKSGEYLRAATDPETVSRVTLIVHAVLSLIKLPAALISGSVGLLNDALDTLLDSLSSLLVHWGIRRDRERQVSMLLLLFMSITGLYSFYEAVKGIISARIPEPDFLAFGAMALSALLCGGLWFYQKFSGLKHQSLPLLAQSLDSKNHVIIAAGVVAGLVASVFRIPYLDSVAGLGISVLILKGAAELLITLIRTGKEEELDLSPFGFTGFEKHRRRQLKTWLLYRVSDGKYGDWDELKDDALSSLDFQQIPVYRALGIAEGGLSIEDINGIILELEDEKLIEESGSLVLSDEGTESLMKGQGKIRGRSRLLRNIGFIFSAGISLALFYGSHWMLIRLQQLLPAGPVSSFSAGRDWTGYIFLFTGALFFIVGSYLLRHSSHHLHHNRLDPNNPLESSLSQTGPYRLMRHPMYASFFLITAGLGISLASLWGLIIVILNMVMMTINAAIEDKMVMKKLPEAHRRYKEITSSLLLPVPALTAVGILIGLYSLYIFI